MQNLFEEDLKLDKTKISVSDSFEDSEEKKYWHSRSPLERLAHVERLRQIAYGEEAMRRMKKVLEIIQIKDK